MNGVLARPLIPPAKVLGCFKTGGVSSRRGYRGRRLRHPRQLPKALKSLAVRRCRRIPVSGQGSGHAPAPNPFNPSLNSFSCKKDICPLTP